MGVSIARSSAEARHKYVGTECANHANHIAERDVMSAPLLECLFRSFRKSEVGHARKPLLDSVVLIGSQEFQRAQHSQLVGESVARFVLSALAARQRAE